MSLSDDRNRLAALTRELWSHWEQTRAVWHDTKQLEFEKRYMEELRASVDRALAHVERLDQILNQVKHDCD